MLWVTLYIEHITLVDNAFGYFVLIIFISIFQNDLGKNTLLRIISVLQAIKNTYLQGKIGTRSQFRVLMTVCDVYHTDVSLMFNIFIDDHRLWVRQLSSKQCHTQNRTKQQICVSKLERFHLACVNDIYNEWSWVIL